MIKYIMWICFVGLVLGDVIIDKPLSMDQTVAEIESQLGYDYTDKKPNLSIKGVSIEAGKKLVHEGISVNEKGKKSRKQSKHFVCTSCHNVVNEDPNLANVNPDDRLAYAKEKGLPYLQGTTLYGAVNRKTYYNGDYDKKYGDLVATARNDIRGAIQLCAVECAQGRPLKDWEIESVLAYLWTLELTTEDIAVNESQLNQWKKGEEGALKEFQKLFPQAAPATFVPPPANRKAGVALQGSATNGEILYKQSCLHCHYQGKYSYLHLDETSMSKNYLKRHMTSYHPHSIYQVTRWGVPTKSGKRSYMPQYPVEKMSEQQLADLRAYIEQ